MIPYKFKGTEVYLTPQQIRDNIGNGDPKILFKLEIALCNNIINARRHIASIEGRLATLTDWYDYKKDDGDKPSIDLCEHNGYEMKVSDLSMDELESRIIKDTESNNIYTSRYRRDVVQYQELFAYLQKEYPNRPKYYTVHENYLVEALSVVITSRL